MSSAFFAASIRRSNWIDDSHDAEKVGIYVTET